MTASFFNCIVIEDHRTTKLWHTVYHYYALLWRFQWLSQKIPFYGLYRKYTIQASLAFIKVLSSTFQKYIFTKTYQLPKCCHYTCLYLSTSRIHSPFGSGFVNVLHHLCNTYCNPVYIPSKSHNSKKSPNKCVNMYDVTYSVLEFRRALQVSCYNEKLTT